MTTPPPPPPSYPPTAGLVTTWWTPGNQPSTATVAPLPQTFVQPAQPTVVEPGRGGWLKPGAWGALAKTAGVATIALVVPFSAWGSLTFTWAHTVWLIGGRDHGSAGAHVFAGAVCAAAIGLAWAIDPGDPTGQRLRIRLKHYLSRVLRWAATCGSLLYIPVALGVIHPTTGV